MSEWNELPPAAQILLMEYHANWLPLSEVQAAGPEAAEAGCTGVIHFPHPPLSPEQEADFRVRWRAVWKAAEAALAEKQDAKT